MDRGGPKNGLALLSARFSLTRGVKKFYPSKLSLRCACQVSCNALEDVDIVAAHCSITLELIAAKHEKLEGASDDGKQLDDNNQ